MKKPDEEKSLIKKLKTRKVSINTAQKERKHSNLTYVIPTLEKGAI